MTQQPVQTPAIQSAPWSISLVRVVGYGLILFGLIDLIAILVPPSFKDPTWEFQTLGEIVERVPVPLLGLLFVFYGESTMRQRWEFLVLKILSWITLLLAILSFAFIGLGLNATLRLNSNITLQVDNARSQTKQQIQQARDNLQQSTDNQLQALLRQLENAGRSPEVQTPQELRERLSAEFEQAEQQVQERSGTAALTQRKALLKQSLKWNLGALISVFLYFYLWRQSAWARRKTKKNKAKKW